jgi:hypothetical protein
LPTGPVDENKGPGDDGTDNKAGGSSSGGQDPPQGGGNPPSRGSNPVPGPVAQEGADGIGDLDPNRVPAKPRGLLSCHRRDALLASARAASVELVSRHWALSQQVLINEVEMLSVDALPIPSVNILTEQESLKTRYKRLYSALETEEADYNYLSGDGVAPAPPVKRCRW